MRNRAIRDTNEETYVLMKVRKAQMKTDVVVSIIHLPCIFVIATLKQTEILCNSAIKESPEVLALSFTNVTHLDSTAIGFLVKLLNNSLSRNIKLVLFDMNPGIREMFDIVKLGKFFSIFTKEQFEATFKYCIQ